jgi:outer membrane protein assembly factor BamA
VEVRGIEAIRPPVRLPRRLPLRPGGPYTEERLAATEEVVLRAVAESGHPYADIEVSAAVDAAGRAAVVLDVDPGPETYFGEVALRVPAPLREADIAARVRFRPGDRFRPSAVEETRRVIQMLPGVQGVIVEAPAVEQGATVVPIIIRVARPERFAGISGGGSISSSECLELVGAWQHQHFLGGPRVVSVSGGFSNLFASLLDGGFPCASAGEGTYAQANYALNLDYLQPVGADPHTAVQARLFFRRRSAAQSYIVHGFGLHAAALREVRPFVNLRLAYAPERNEIVAAGHYFCINFGACTEDAMEGLAGPRWLAPLEVSVQWVPPGALHPFGGPGTREAGLWPGVLGPRWRSTARAGLAVAAGPTGSDYAYLRGVAEATLTRVVSPRTELATRVRAGAVGAGDDVVPPQVRFFSGGPTTVRGAAQNLLGPVVLVTRPGDATAMGCEPVPGGCPPELRPDPDRTSVRPLGGATVLEANVEARLWLARSFQLAAFADAGLLRGGGGGLVEPRWEGLLAPGAGFRWLTALGPIRVDLGYDPRPERRVPILLQAPGQADLVHLGDVAWAPHTHDAPGPWRELIRRLQLHLAVGQPF